MSALIDVFYNFLLSIFLPHFLSIFFFLCPPTQKAVFLSPFLSLSLWSLEFLSYSFEFTPTKTSATGTETA